MNQQLTLHELAKRCMPFEIYLHLSTIVSTSRNVIHDHPRNQEKSKSDMYLGK